MLANINYRGMVSSVKGMQFPSGKPKQIVDKTGKYTIVIFQSGKCRIMGCKKPIVKKDLQYKIRDIQLQSITVTLNLDCSINLYKLAKKLEIQCMFEPELFPALRYLKYNPLCVNIFASGKVVVLGIRSLNYDCIVDNIKSDISSLIRCLD